MKKQLLFLAMAVVFVTACSPGEEELPDEGEVNEVDPD
ncbi:hypothetical protein HNR44_001422 [Geomicrobium halophilum]|uniref:Uncharacterized protein n=1 Tax=Geomicrobium halophilum TaxID=549000 RepID=A0A841PY22_9BACL|nr:hypothetical protein [Geomicrobium halophilum]